MRIYSDDDDSVLKGVTLLLQESEARNLFYSLQDLLKQIDNNHAHVNDESYEHEITLAVYNNQNLESFDKRIQQVSAEDV